MGCDWILATLARAVMGGDQCGFAQLRLIWPTASGRATPARPGSLFEGSRASELEILEKLKMCMGWTVP
jgi:hypothetical protein